MNPISLLPQSGTNYKLYYLVPFSFAYLFSQLGNQIYLLYSAIALAGVVSRHSHGEAMYGPNGEEKDELTTEEKVRRLGTTMFYDKAPSKYSATTTSEMIKEGNFRSKYWGLFVFTISLFQISFSAMYVIAIYELVIHQFTIDFVGVILLFGLTTLLLYGAMKTLWPKANSLADNSPEIGTQLNEIIVDFRRILEADGIYLSGGYYEPTEGGVLETDYDVNHEYGETIRKDVNGVAITFCSIVDRSSYPIKQGEFSLITEDEVTVEFEIDPMWSRQLLGGHISSNKYLHEVHQTVSVSSPNEPVAESYFEQEKPANN